MQSGHDFSKRCTSADFSDDLRKREPLRIQRDNSLQRRVCHGGACSSVRRHHARDTSFRVLLFRPFSSTLARRRGKMCTLMHGFFQYLRSFYCHVYQTKAHGGASSSVAHVRPQAYAGAPCQSLHTGCKRLQPVPPRPWRASFCYGTDPLCMRAGGSRGISRRFCRLIKARAWVHVANPPSPGGKPLIDEHTVEA